MYTETEFEALIKSVETEFSAHLAEVEKNFQLSKAEGATTEPLAKAEDGEKKPEPKKEDGKEKAPAEAKPEGEKAPEGEKKDAPPAEAAPAAPGEKAPPAEAAPGAAPAAPAAPGAEAEGHDYDAEDLAHLQQMYMSMSKAELLAHHDACRAALDSKGMEQCGSAAAPAPQAPGAAPAAPMGKAEITSHDKASGGQISKENPPHEVPGAKSPASKVEGVQMEKSENNELELAKAEIAAEKAKSETLQKNLDAVSAFLTKLVEKKVAPQGKAITTLDVIAKGEGSSDEKPLTKSEIDSALSKKAMDPKLEKSDRDLINAYYLNSGSLNSISHLLK